MDKKTLTLTALAAYLGVPKRTLYNMIGDKRFDIRPVPNTRPRRWNVEDIDAWRNGETYPRIGD